MKDLITLNSRVIELNNKSSNTREVIMHVHTLDEENANGLTFTTDSTEKHMHTLIDKPVVVKMDSTESDFKGHEPIYDASGKIIKLDTIPVGTITDVWIEDRDIDGEIKKALMAKATIWSYKYPTVIEIMQNLLDDGNLDTSVEVAIFSYTEDSTIEHRKTVDIEYLSNCMLGSLIMPADSNAGVIEMFYKEVAQALNPGKPDDMSSLNINNSQNGGVPMISMEEIKDQLRALLNPNDNQEGGWKLDYYTWDMFTYDTHCVVRNAEDGKYYKLNYEVQNETTVVLVGEPIEQVHDFKDVVQGELAEVDGMFAKFKELSATLEQKETEINELQTQKETELSTLQNEIAELQKVKNETEVKDGAIIKLNEQINSLKDEMSNLQPMINEYNQLQEEKRIAELNAQKESLKQMALKSKMITEQELCENEQIKNMVEELNEKGIKELIADRIIEANSKEIPNTELNSTNDDVIVSVGEVKDLLPEDKRSKLYRPSEK